MKTKFNHMTRRQIDRYPHTGPEEQHQLERQLDNFDQDALDGWTESGLATSAGMKRTDRHFLRPSAISWYVFTAAAVVVTGLLVFLFTSREADTPKSAAKVITKVEATEIALPEEIDTLQELPVTQQLRIAVVRHEQKHLTETDAPGQTPPVNSTSPTVNVPELPEKPIPDKIAANSIRKTAAELYLSDLKLVDYTKYRSKPAISAERIVITGTPADQEENTQEISTTKETIEIPYIEYIAKTAKLISRERWKEALQRLEIVLQHYPDDVNAHFYAGICAYNLRQSEKAIEHFRFCQTSIFDNFYLESQWYEAKALLTVNKTEAVQLLRKIIEQNGFYADQAKKLLKQVQ